jgi:hypothetical protein
LATLALASSPSLSRARPIATATWAQWTASCWWCLARKRTLKRQGKATDAAGDLDVEEARQQTLLY